MPARRLDLQQASHTLIAYSAACWAFVFGVFHIAWAAGWYIGLDPQWARTAFAKPWMLVYDVVVVGMCMVAVPVALALGMPWGRRLPRGILSILAWTGTCLLVLRAVASLVIEIVETMWNRDSVRGTVEGVTLRDIRVTGRHMPTSRGGVTTCSSWT